MSAPEVKFTQLFINNEWVPAVSGKTFKTYNPADKTVIAEVAEADKADVDIAVAAATKAFELNSEWRTMSPSGRGKLLFKLADEIEANQDYLAALETLDNGKPVQIAKAADVALTADCYRYYGAWADKNNGQVLQVDGDFHTYTRVEPVGVVGQIIPWNFPLLMQAWKLGPALASGCCCVIKLAEQTPLTGLFVASLIKKVGFPPGVVNVLNGFGPTCGAAISSHMKIDKVAFTGSTEVGHLIAESAAKSNLKRVSLELGGKSPLIIFPDANLDEAVATADLGLFFNHGQCCCASSRIYVHEDIHDQFVAKAVASAQKKNVGNPMTGNSDQGPQIDEEQQQKILGLIKSGIEEGAKMHCGGAVGDSSGYYVQPTVFSEVTDNMRIAREEIFGPVMQVMKFSSIDEVLKRANDTDYGLAAGVMTNDIDTMHRMTMGLRAGTVWVNCYDNFDNRAPFGGYKKSGYGRDKSGYALEAYTEVKCVTIKIPKFNS